MGTLRSGELRAPATAVLPHSCAIPLAQAACHAQLNSPHPVRGCNGSRSAATNSPSHNKLHANQLSPALHLPIIPASHAAGRFGGQSFATRHAPRSV
jgi:hypothetical protein